MPTRFALSAVLVLAAGLLPLQLARGADAAPAAPLSAAAEAPPPPDKGSDSGLPVPRFVSLAADKVNARTGPGARYPIAWQYQRRHLPVEVIAEYEYWRRIRDHDGTEAWVHKNLTSGRRYGLVTGHVQPLYDKPDEVSDVLLTAEPGVQARLRKCPNRVWCEVEISGTRGWMQRTALWGVYRDETFD
ncbi:SH3 domain-containing protein [Ferrovibrio xuzhouensis]|uniref:SH3 domain-containing protein n=1 Tax=Ferrovibrio xuzhouensis TaxID=1576914 RepID=A0ABV7VHS1_9PROT